MSVSMIAAFVIMILATGNIFITLYALVTIACIISCVVAIMVFRGYEVGASESIAMVVIIGFSVDYVVHLAAHYVHSEERKRFERSTEAVRDMGVSIFSGGATTFGAGIFLFGGQVLFFEKFAVAISCTVIIALIYSLVFFQAVCHTIGPQENFG